MRTTVRFPDATDYMHAPGCLMSDAGRYHPGIPGERHGRVGDRFLRRSGDVFRLTPQAYLLRQCQCVG
jgi:hypothetical protein